MLTRGELLASESATVGKSTQYIEPLTCAHPLRVHDGGETPTTVAEVRTPQL